MDTATLVTVVVLGVLVVLYLMRRKSRLTREDMD
jgi:hypothetical protein